VPTTINLAPSADDATQFQFLLGALVCVQVWAQAKFKPLQAAAISNRILIVFIIIVVGCF